MNSLLLTSMGIFHMGRYVCDKVGREGGITEGMVVTMIIMLFIMVVAMVMVTVMVMIITKSN